MGESARWHDERFWCSDWASGEVLSVAVDGADVGKPTIVTRSTSFPFCFDWTTDDELLVTGRRGVERLGPGGRLVLHTDLSHLSEYGWNEIVVHPSGAAYVNGINFDMMGADGMNFELGSKRGLIAVVTPGGGTRIVADTVAFPNGMAITPDGATLFVAESFASRVAAFDVEEDHSLTNRRVSPRSTAAPTASASTPMVRCGVPHRAARSGWRRAARFSNGSSSTVLPSPLPSADQTGRRCSWSPTNGTAPRTSARALARG